MRPWYVLGLVVSGVVVMAGTAVAGPLDPPAGPIAPTPGPEPRTAINATNTPGDADSVFRITQPGSYYLTGNVIGQAGKKGIEVAAANVTVDLNGFQVLGVASSLAGIESTFPGTTVRNGTVASWGSAGVDLDSAARIDNVCARFNGGDGLSVGIESLITSSVASTNGRGIVCTSCCVSIIGCVVQGNFGTGIIGLSTTSVIDCVVTNNTGIGVDLGANGVLRGCSVTFNTGHGAQNSTRCLISGNLFSTNGLAGLRVAGLDSRIEGNTSSGNSTGVLVAGAGNFLAGNICSGNPTNWDVAANNKCLVVLGVDAPAFSGDSGGVSPGSTNPFANFTY